MTSRQGGGKPVNYSSAVNSSRGKQVAERYEPTLNLTHGVENVKLDHAEDSGWEVYGKKSKNRAGSMAEKPKVHQNSNPIPGPNPWGRPDVVQKLGMQNNIASSNDPWTRTTQTSGRGQAWPQSSINRGRETNWSAGAGSGMFGGCVGGRGQAVDTVNKEDNVVADESDDIGSDALDSDDDDYDDDDFDSDTSVKSHETEKKNKWFKAFFEMLDKLTNDEINEPARQWHCPACQDGPGAIDWFSGLQPLLTHANTRGSRRVMLHRKFAKLLKDELSIRGTVLTVGEAYGQWRGLEKTIKDHEIVWPPMVVIMNTVLDMGENEKWLGMGSQELLEYFKDYPAVKAKHSYGPQGHRGMSMLIFEPSAVGYVEAERLHKHFESQRTDRYAWDNHPVKFYSGGKRQLYGYMATKDDVNKFNQHSQGKSKLKFEMRSYREMFVGQMKQMSEATQELIMIKDKHARERRRAKAAEEICGIMTEKLRNTVEENKIVRQKTKIHHQQNKEEMDFQERFFMEQIETIQKTRDAKEAAFELLQQEKREKVKQENANPSARVNQRRSKDEVAKFIKLQDDEMEEFVSEREKLIKSLEEKKADLRKKLLEQELELEREYDANLAKLMAKYSHS